MYLWIASYNRYSYADFDDKGETIDSMSVMVYSIGLPS